MISKTEFKDKFLPLPQGFSNPVEFTDNTYGFSVYKESSDRYASLFKIYIRQEEFLESDSLKKIDASVSYGKKTDEGLVLSSSAEKIKTLGDPIDLSSTDEFFYDENKDKFFYKNKTIEAPEILKELDKLHRKTTKWWEIILKFKLIWFHIILSKLYKGIFSVVSALQFIVSGAKRSIYEDFFEPRNKPGFSFHDIEKEPRKKPINFYGYEVEVWLVISYSFIHLLIFLIFYLIEYKPLIIQAIFDNSFISLMYAVFTVGITNELLPDILRPSKKIDKLLYFIQSKYYKTGFKKIKIQTSLKEWGVLIIILGAVAWLLWNHFM